MAWLRYVRRGVAGLGRGTAADAVLRAGPADAARREHDRLEEAASDAYRSGVQEQREQEQRTPAAVTTARCPGAF